MKSFSPVFNSLTWIWFSSYLNQLLPLEMDEQLIENRCWYSAKMFDSSAMKEAAEFFLLISFFIDFSNLAEFSWGSWFATVDLKKDRMRTIWAKPASGHPPMGKVKIFFQLGKFKNHHSTHFFVLITDPTSKTNQNYIFTVKI
jgi:hypothetical protein